MKQYDIVQVVALRTGRFAQEAPSFQRHPRIGDIGTIVEVYADAFEIECCEPSTGVTIWLESMFPEELQPI